jgi:hypothetical protein
MKRIDYSKLAFLATLALAAGFTTSEAATPIPNSAIVLERLYDNCPISTVSSVNAFPGSISISDSWNALCVGFANGHAWNFSGDGGSTSLNLGNNGSYKFKATVVLNGSGTVEGGIHIAPWWNNMDGRFQARIPDGEVACFGGRLPFYSFTVNHGVVYTAGDPITMEIEYLANGLSAGSPASIVYRLTYGANSYSSPVLLFDQGNPAEDPPHGQWGALDPAYAGGVVQVNNGSGGANYNATWTDIDFDCLDCIVPVKNASWGHVKTIYR